MDVDRPSVSPYEADRRIAELEVRHRADQGMLTGSEVVRIVDRAFIGQLEADRAADRKKIANLEIALISARRIGAAVGIVMAQLKVSDEQAFAMLREASQNQNRKLRDVAEDVLLTGTVE